MSEAGPLVAVGGLAFTLLISIVGAFRYFSAEITAVRAMVTDGRRDDMTTMTAADNDLRDRIDQVSEAVHRLEVEVVRKGDLTVSEDRLRREMSAGDSVNCDAVQRSDQARASAVEQILRTIGDIPAAVVRAMRQ